MQIPLKLGTLCNWEKYGGNVSQTVFYHILGNSSTDLGKVWGMNAYP